MILLIVYYSRSTTLILLGWSISTRFGVDIADDSLQRLLISPMTSKVEVYIIYIAIDNT